MYCLLQAKAKGELLEYACSYNDDSVCIVSYRQRLKVNYWNVLVVLMMNS